MGSDDDEDKPKYIGKGKYKVKFINGKASDEVSLTVK